MGTLDMQSGKFVHLPFAYEIHEIVSVSRNSEAQTQGFVPGHD